MKKYLAIVLTLLFIFTSCAPSDPAPATPNPAPAVELVPEETPKAEEPPEAPDDEGEKISEEMLKAASIYGATVEGEDAVLEALDYDFGWNFANTISQFGTAEDGRGFHLTGTTAGMESSQYAYDTFREIGLDPEFIEFPVTSWTFKDSTIKIDNHEDVELRITSAPYTPATPEEGIYGEIVFVNYGTKEDLEKIDLEGKIALISFNFDYMPWHSRVALQAQEKGAIGAIYYYSAYDSLGADGNAEFVGDWSGARSEIPVWAMPFNHGVKLTELAQKETIKARITSKVEFNEDATGRNVIAKIEGKKYPDEYIIVNAHTDAYFKCLQDDSLGVGVLMGMAKAMVDSGYEPDRTILFITTDAEEIGQVGTYFDWLQGSWALMNEKISEWDGKVVNAHVIEMLGYKDAEKFGYRVCDTTYLFAQAMANSFNEQSAFEYEVLVDNWASTSSDEWSFSYFGIPSGRTIFEDGAEGIYHSSQDTPEYADIEIYKSDQRLQTQLILRFDKTPFAPYDLSRTPEVYLSELSQEKLDHSKLGTELAETVTKYHQDTDALLENNLEITQLYNKAVAAGKDITSVDDLAQAYNQKMRNAAKLVIQGTQSLALDTPMSSVIYYQDLPTEFSRAIANLESGNGSKMVEEFVYDNEDYGLAYCYYADYMTYPVWKDMYKEVLDPENTTDYKQYWATGRLLKLYDFYNILMIVEKKAASEDADYTEEIVALQEMHEDSSKRLVTAYETELAMWQNASSEVPLEQSEEILTLLKEL